MQVQFRKFKNHQHTNRERRNVMMYSKTKMICCTLMTVLLLSSTPLFALDWVTYDSLQCRGCDDLSSPGVSWLRVLWPSIFFSDPSSRGIVAEARVWVAGEFRNVSFILKYKKSN